MTVEFQLPIHISLNVLLNYEEHESQRDQILF